MYTTKGLDESLCSYEAAEVAVELGSGSIFNIKPSRCGGITQALRIMKLAHANGIVCWLGGMLESGIGVQFCKALAALEPCSYPADLFPSKKWYDAPELPAHPSLCQASLPSLLPVMPVMPVSMYA